MRLQLTFLCDELVFQALELIFRILRGEFRVSADKSIAVENLRHRLHTGPLLQLVPLFVVIHIEEDLPERDTTLPQKFLCSRAIGAKLRGVDDYLFGHACDIHQPANPMNTLGLRHVALNVKDPQVSKEFYIRVLKMQLEWEPDPENVYLTSGGLDNLALHKASDGESSTGILDHIGFALPSLNDVDEWYQWIQGQGARILREIKTHRDGARSFYFSDPDGITIQMIYHPPISRRATA
jgi:catechol 2,3-dioxygenase-like lactoylglutathione lyase family enzyme